MERLPYYQLLHIFSLLVLTAHTFMAFANPAPENRGRTLTHDYVVLEWQGPFAFGPGGKVAERRALPLLPKGEPARSGVVGFVQDRRTGEVLQAVLRSAC